MTLITFINDCGTDSDTELPELFQNAVYTQGKSGLFYHGIKM